MSQEIIHEFGKMNELLDKMEKERKVDLAILDNISSLKKSFESLEKRMIDEKGSDRKSRFLSYHIYRNISLILTKMEKRFQIAERIHDNPVVADNSVSVLASVTQAANVAFKYGGKHLNAKEEQEMLFCIDSLRDSASRESMLIKAEEEAKTLSVQELGEEGKILADTIDQTYFKEKGIR